MLPGKIGAVDILLLLSSSCPLEAGRHHYYFPLCVNLRIKCEPDGDIEHQRQVTMYVCMYATSLPFWLKPIMGVLGFIFWPFCGMAGLRA